jgi:hypothetical protein
LILTVTVLQTLKKEDLENTIRLFDKILSANGILLCMEFFRDDTITGEYNEMKATTGYWKSKLAQHNFKIVAETNFYNPITQPTKSWYYYNTNLYLKVLKLFKHSAHAQAKFTETAKKLIGQHKDVLLTKESAFKIYTIKKEHSCN